MSNRKCQCNDKGSFLPFTLIKAILSMLCDIYLCRAISEDTDFIQSLGSHMANNQTTAVKMSKAFYNYSYTKIFRYFINIQIIIHTGGETEAQLN